MKGPNERESLKGTIVHTLDPWKYNAERKRKAEPYWSIKREKERNSKYKRVFSFVGNVVYCLTLLGR